MGFSGGSVVKSLPAYVGDMSSILIWEDPLEKGTYPLQYSLLENSMDRGAWQGPWGYKELDMTKQLNMYINYKYIFMYNI